MRITRSGTIRAISQITNRALAERLSRRGIRALGLIVLAVIVVVAASIVYLYPTLTSRTKTASPSSNLALVTGVGDHMSFDFVTASLGWALDISSAPAANPGQFWVFRTVDGAKHWQKQFMGLGITSVFFQFFDNLHGFVAVGYPIELYRTLDGGVHWEPIGLPNSGGQQVAFSDWHHGWLLAAPNSTLPPLNLYASGDGGDSWQKLPDPPVDSVLMTFRGSSEGWIGSTTAGQPHVYTSANGGRNWQRHDLPEPPYVLPSKTAITATVRLLPGDGGIADLVADSGPGGGPGYELISDDGGTSWKYLPSRPNQIFAGGETFEDAVHWWAIDGGIVYKSSDAGQTWTPVSGQLGPLGNNWQYYPHVLDSKHAWARVAVGEFTGLALTNDGGTHWTRATVPQPA